MASDLKLIKQLEKEIGEELKQVEFDKIWRENAFSMDKNDNVNGLNLDRMKLEKIPLIITKFHHLKELSLNGNEISEYKVAGIKLLKIIRELNPNLPVIMITAIDERKIAVETIKLGAKDYIVKDDISNEGLIQKVEEVLRNEQKQLEKLIANGENERLEFKSTLRWNLKANKPGKEIEFAWLKTIVAFMNTEGGTLLIGVKDDKNILGIEPDKFPNEDKFLLHFSHLINQHIGSAFSKFIKFELVPVGGKKILFAECEKSDEPVFLLKNKKEEDFYVRVGPSTRRLTCRDMWSYLKNKKN